MPDPVRFTVPGPLWHKERGRTNRWGRIYTPQATLDWEARIRDIAAPLFPAPMVGPVALSIVAVYPIPARLPRYLREAAYMGPKLGKPDIDNIIKAVYDALNGVAYPDDSYICESAERKRYGLREEMHVTVTPLGSEAYRAAWARYGWPGSKPKPAKD